MKTLFFILLAVASFDAQALTKFNTLNVSIGYTTESFDYSLDSEPFSDSGRGIAFDVRYFDSSLAFGGLSFRYRDGERFPSGGAVNVGLEFGGYASMWTFNDGIIGDLIDGFPEWFDLGTGVSVTAGYHHFSGEHPVYEPHMSFVANAYTFIRLFNVFLSYSYGLEARLGAISKVWDPNVKIDTDAFPSHSTFQAGWLF